MNTQNIIGPLETLSIDFATLPNFGRVVQYFSQNFSPKKLNLLEPLILLIAKLYRNFLKMEIFQNLQIQNTMLKHVNSKIVIFGSQFFLFQMIF